MPDQKPTMRVPGKHESINKTSGQKFLFLSIEFMLIFVAMYGLKRKLSGVKCFDIGKML